MSDETVPQGSPNIASAFSSEEQAGLALSGRHPIVIGAFHNSHENKYDLDICIGNFENPFEAKEYAEKIKKLLMWALKPDLEPQMIGE